MIHEIPLPPSRSSSPLAWFLIHINVVLYCRSIINGISFAYLTLLLTSLLCVSAHVSPGMSSPQHTPSKTEGGEGVCVRISSALFGENLSLICCSCRGPFGQLKRTGFGSFPNEVTTCYPWIGHLEGTVGHRGIWLSFPLWSAWGKHTPARRGKKKKGSFLYLVSCPASSKIPSVFRKRRRVSSNMVQSGI